MRTWLFALLLMATSSYAKTKDDIITIQSKAGDEVKAQTFETTKTPTQYSTGFILEKNWTKKAVFKEVKAQAALPRHFDWREQGKLTPVRDQGNCGSCYAFATATVFQDIMALRGLGQIELSPQYIVSCNKEGWSCNGGFFGHDYHLALPMGAVPEAEFPYVARQVPCKEGLSHPYHLSSWAYLPAKDDNTPPTVESIKAAIYQFGPVAVAVGAGNAFMSYSSGIYNQCDGTKPNHAVVLTGWDDDGQFWYLKNSWSERWGDQGYMKIKYGCNYVGVAANYVVFNSSNPTPEPQPPTPNPKPTVTPTPTPTPVPKCTPEPYANAGRDATIRRGQLVKLGTAPRSGTSYHWEAPGYRLPDAPMFVVRPPKTQVFTVFASTKCGTARDSALIIVQ